MHLAVKNLQIGEGAYRKPYPPFVEMSKIQNTNTSIKFLGIHGLRLIKYHLIFVALVMLGMQTIWQQISQIK